MHKRQRARAKSAAIDERRKGAEAEAVDADGKRRGRTSFVPQTELGRRLWRIRQRIVDSGLPLLDWKGIESELRERTGEATGEA